MLKGQLYSPSFLVCHLSLSKKNAAFFRPSLLNLYRYDAIQLQKIKRDNGSYQILVSQK